MASVFLNYPFRKNAKYAVLVALAFAVIIFRPQIGDLLVDLAQSPGRVRWAAWLSLAVLGLYCALHLVRVRQVVRVHRGQFTWRMSLRATDWWIGGLSAVLTVIFVLIGAGEPMGPPLQGLTAVRALDLVLPLMTGLGAAILISLDDEPGLELHLSYPRPFAWLVAERLIIVLTIQGVIGLVGTGFAALLAQREVWPALWGWLPVAVLSAGVGIRVTLSTRQIAFGASAAVGLCLILRTLGESLLIGYPFVWPVFPFLQPSGLQFLQPGISSVEGYMLNRLLVALIGVALTISGLGELRDEEHIFTGRYGLRSERTSTP